MCFCGRVIAGNAARKVHTRDFDAFRGFTEDDEHRVEEFLTAEAVEDGGTVFYNRLDPSAAVLKLTPGISAEMVHDMGIHLRALIVEGFGMGGIPDYGNGELAEVFRNLSSCGVRVIMTTQVFQGGLRPVGVQGRQGGSGSRAYRRRGHDDGIRGNARDVGACVFL